MSTLLSVDIVSLSYEYDYVLTIGEPVIYHFIPEKYTTTEWISRRNRLKESTKTCLGKV